MRRRSRPPDKPVHVHVRNYGATGRPFRIYGAYVDSISWGEGRCVVNGHVVTEKQIRRGWVDADNPTR